MAVFRIDNIALKGIAACVPTNIARTEDYAHISAQERKLFASGTGISERRVAADDTCASDLCYAAALQLLKDTDTAPEDINILIFVSQSPDYVLPATSILLQERLGCSKHTMAFDINLGCSGFVYGLAVISNLLSLPGFSKGLLLCGDVSTYSTSYTDKSTYPLFGDAGTATLIGKHENASPLYFNLQSDGGGWESIIIRGGGTRNKMNDQTLQKVTVSPGITRSSRDLELDGLEVFNFSLREVKPNISALLDFAGISADDIDYLVMHQANKLMNESIRKKLKVSAEKVPYSIGKFGNTSSASIPLTIVTELQEALKADRKQLLLSGFGVGYSWGSVLAETENIVISDLIEI